MKRLITKPLLISTLNCLMKPLLLTLFVQLWLDLLYFCLASWNVTLSAKAWNPKLMLNPMRTKLSSFIGDSHFMSADAPYAGRGRSTDVTLRRLTFSCVLTKKICSYSFFLKNWWFSVSSTNKVWIHVSKVLGLVRLFQVLVSFLAEEGFLSEILPS